MKRLPLLALGTLVIAGAVARTLPDFLFWLFAPILLLALAACLERDRRRTRRSAEGERRWREGRCVACGYSLRGNVSGTCPECGTPASN